MQEPKVKSSVDYTYSWYVFTLLPGIELTSLKMNLVDEEDKMYDPRDTTLTFVDSPDDLDPLPSEEEDSLRAQMSCGHAVTPESLTGWCRSLLDQGNYVFKCPALKDGERCNAIWPYREVRRLAALTAEEIEYFEENIARLAAMEFCDFKACPGCKTFLERKDLTNLCVQCTVCTSDKKAAFQFCWQCFKPWKGRGPRSDRCDNEGCINQDLELLRTCKTTFLSQVQGVGACPSIRACPTCGQKTEHDTTGCKNVICTRCQVEFCFVCLKRTRVCLQTSSHFNPCSEGIAPRQTSIPVWHRK
uniref:RING-type domain-containing protein n=1 Tax=Oryzias latipes TaxID=8090 RepID=A0A3P9H8B0_ORYLA